MSARTPVRGEKSRAKKEVDDVMRDLSRVVKERFERSVEIETRVEEMTPVLGRLVERVVMMESKYHTHSRIEVRLHPRRL